MIIYRVSVNIRHNLACVSCDQCPKISSSILMLSTKLKPPPWNSDSAATLAGDVLVYAWLVRLG